MATVASRSASQQAHQVNLPVICYGMLDQPLLMQLQPSRIMTNPDCALDRASWIARAEPLWDVLERWMQRALDFIPLDDAGIIPTAKEVLALQLDSRFDPAFTLRIHLPLSMLNQLPVMSGELYKRLKVRMQHVDAQCELARLMVPDEQLAQLTRGALLLLPQSFHARWTVLLCADVVHASAVLDAENSLIFIDDDNASHSPQDVLTNLAGSPDADQGKAVQQATSIPANEVAARELKLSFINTVSWNPLCCMPSGRSQQIALDNAVLESTCVAHIHGMNSLQGQLIAVGDGYGFLVEHQHCETHQI